MKAVHWFKNSIPLIAALLVFTSAPHVSARRTDDTYNYDRWGEAIPSRAGYTAAESISGRDLGVSDFADISDIFLASDGSFFICDSGNGRIVVTDSEFEKKAKIIDEINYKDQKLSLENPGGIYVSDEGLLYIADTGNSRVIRCDLEGNADLVIEKPDSVQYTAVTFVPQRVLADKAGFIYVVDGNITGGAVLFDSEGNFSGYYGANRVQQTGEVLRNYFWKFFAGDEMRKYMINAVPSAISSFDNDEKGFIYTCSSSLSQDIDMIKKVNAAGYNLFADMETDFGDRPTADYSEYPQNSYVDIDVSPTGLINCLDYTNGRIFQYDEECNLLFIFGGKGYQLGTFRQVSAVESSEDCLYVADSQKNTVTVFEETEFGRTVHHATELYNAGYYDEALEPWFDVLEQDGNYRMAHKGIASAYINQGRYREAMKYAKLADSQWRYDRAFEGWREEFVSTHLTELILAAAALILITVFAGRYLRKKSSCSGKTVTETAANESNAEGDEAK